MGITAVIQFLLTAAQLFGSQDYYNKSLMMILGLAWGNVWSFVRKKILNWAHREARGGLKATAGTKSNNYLSPGLSLYPHLFRSLFCFVSLSQRLLFLPGRLAQTISAHLGHCGSKPGCILKNALNTPDSYYCSFMKTNIKKTKADQKTYDFVDSNYLAY